MEYRKSATSPTMNTGSDKPKNGTLNKYLEHHKSRYSIDTYGYSYLLTLNKGVSENKIVAEIESSEGVWAGTHWWRWQGRRRDIVAW